LRENLPARWTVLEMLRWMTGRFEERGLPSARLDAELIIARALGLTRVQVYTQFDRPLDAEELGRLRDLVRRRQSGECVAYILGEKEFYGLTFQVDRRVLVPRADTETLVDEALTRLREGGWANPRIVDVGTGSGALAITLAKHCPGAEVVAVDLSADALEVAQANAGKLGVAVRFLQGDLAGPLGGLGPFHLLVANLPYVPSADIPGLSKDVQAEPRLALDGGADGLTLVRRLIKTLPDILAEDGAVALEIGKGQDTETASICADAGLVDVRVRRDLGDVARVVSACRPAALARRGVILERPQTDPAAETSPGEQTGLSSFDPDVHAAD
jgi:release factor glutamine methyltransferase